MVFEDHAGISVAALEKISSKNSVYHFDLDNFDKIESIYSLNFIEPSEIEISKFSTFHGFCSQHDKKLFAPIEDEAIVPRPDQLNALHIRALAISYYGNVIIPKIISVLLSARTRFDNPKETEKELLLHKIVL